MLKEQEVNKKNYAFTETKNGHAATGPLQQTQNRTALSREKIWTLGTFLVFLKPAFILRNVKIGYMVRVWMIISKKEASSVDTTTF